MIHSRVSAPWLVWGSSAKGFHFYTLTGSQVLSGCQLLGTNFSPLHIRVLLAYPHVFSLYFLPSPKIQTAFSKFEKKDCEVRIDRWACELIIFSPLLNPNACCHQRLQRGPKHNQESHATTFISRHLLIMLWLLPHPVSAAPSSYDMSLGILFLLCVFSPSFSFSSFPQPGLNFLFLRDDILSFLLPST